MSWKLVDSKETDKVRKYTNEKTGRVCWITETRKLEIPVGLPPGVEPEITDISEKELNRQFLLARRKCFVCGDSNNIGVAVCIKPVDIIDSERLQMSENDKTLNALRQEAEKKLKDAGVDMKAAAAAAAASPKNPVVEEVSSNSNSNPILSPAQQASIQLKTKYNPYPKCMAPTEGIKSLQDMKPSCVTADLVPVYVCVVCRRMGESGSGVGTTHPNFPKVQIPTPKERNIINKYMQANACILRYMDETGKTYPITDRLSVITSDVAMKTNSNNCENVLFQQLELMMDPSKCKLLETLRGKPQFVDRLTPMVSKIIPSLLRAAARLSTKVSGEEELRDMDEFEKTYEFSLVIIRAALHCISTYPEVATRLKSAVLRWAYNPFSPDNKQYFQTWKDVPWIAALTGMPFSFIRHSLIRCLFHEILMNYPQAVGDDKKTYLRRLFNEGRSRNTSRQLLYTMAFTGMLADNIGKVGINGFIKVLDDHECYLPEECLKIVWRDMQNINRTVTSLEPIQVDGELQPGLFKHMGMGDQNADHPTTIDHILKFFEYVKSTSSKMINMSIPENFLSNINVELITQMSTVKRHETLKADETKRREMLKTIHKGAPQIVNGKEARLTLAKCLYKGCGRDFSSTGKLKAHLAEAWNLAQDSPRYNRAEIHRFAFGQESEFDGQYHPWHSVERIKDQALLDGTVVGVGDGGFKCPVMHCGKEFVNLVSFKDHLARYGVKPYLHPGWVSSKANSNGCGAVVEEEKKLASMWDNPGTCIICMDESCEEILLPCGHVCMCTGCRTDWVKRNNTCPTCRTQISKVLPIASYQVGDKSEVKVYMQ